MKKVLCVILGMILIFTACAIAMAEELTEPMIQQAQLIDLTGIAKAVIAVIAAIIARKVIPWIDAKLTNEQKAMMRAAVKTLVFAAEQLYGAGAGARKLDFVLEQLKNQGFTADRVEIEAAVGEYINNWPEITQAVEIETETEIDVNAECNDQA